MSKNAMFDWTYLVTNRDEGIKLIVMKILKHLEPKDINNLAKTNRAIGEFVFKEKHGLNRGYKSVTMKFPRNKWNRDSLESIWSRRYFNECISGDHNVIMEYSTKEELTEVSITGEAKGVLLSSWKLHTTLESDDSNVDVIIQLREDAGQRYRHFSRIKAEKN